MICAVVCLSLTLLLVTYAWWVTQRNWKQQRDLHHHYRDEFNEEKRICQAVAAELRQKLNAANERAADLEASLLVVSKQRDLERAKRDELAAEFNEYAQRWTVNRRMILEAIGDDK